MFSSTERRPDLTGSRCFGVQRNLWLHTWKMTTQGTWPPPAGSRATAMVDHNCFKDWGWLSKQRLSSPLSFILSGFLSGEVCTLLQLYSVIFSISEVRLESMKTFVQSFKSVTHQEENPVHCRQYQNQINSGSKSSPSFCCYYFRLLFQLRDT